jgi:hypothetical protein
LLLKLKVKLNPCKADEAGETEVGAGETVAEEEGRGRGRRENILDTRHS